MEGCSSEIDILIDDSDELSICTVFSVHLCAQTILDLLPVRDLVRSQRVSRQWQAVIHHYLRSCRSLSFHYVVPWDPNNNMLGHRTIQISAKDHSIMLACKIVEKWGPSILELNAAEDWYHNYDKKQYKHLFNIVTSKCSYLRKINMFVTGEKDLNKLKNLKNLRHVSLQYYLDENRNKNTDQLLGDIFQKLECDAITIDLNDCLTGSFMKSINCNKLKSLYLISCEYLDVSEMLPAVETLRSITTLHVDYCHISFIFEVDLLFKEMTQLEELSLRGYNKELEVDPIEFEPELFESVSELVNLKRLYMENTKYANDTLLEALARGCKKLECLDIRGSARRISLEGLTALCQRSETARTTLHFGVPQGDLVDDFLQVYFSGYFEDVEVYQGLAMLGCVELTLEWFSAACRDPRGRELPLNPNPVQAGDAQELKIVLFDDTFYPFRPLENLT